jgi:hypothetical protein
MDKRIARALAAGTVMALPLLTACGGGSAPQGSAAPPASSAAAPAAEPAPASPSASSKPSDETENVKEASLTFMTALLSFESSTGYDEYEARVEPLITKAGVKSFEDADFEKALATFRTRFGKQARTVVLVKGAPKVKKLTSDSATVALTAANRIQQRRDGKWRTVKTSVDDTFDLPLVHEGERWLVDDLS